jgi:hypothetical protein
MADSEAVEHTLAVARAALVAPTAARARVRSALDARGAFAAASTRSASVKSAGVSKLTAMLLVGMSFGAGYWLGVHRSVDPGSTATASAVADPVQALPPPRSEAMHSTPSPLERIPVVSAADAPTADDSTPPMPNEAAVVAEPAPLEATAARSRSTRNTGAVSAPYRDRLALEIALLQRAERAIRAGEATLALSFVDELDRKYPASSLSEERAAARLMAECLDSKPGARSRAVHFLRDRPTSVYSDRVRRCCELGAPRSASAEATERTRPDTDRVKE